MKLTECLNRRMHPIIDRFRGWYVRKTLSKRIVAVLVWTLISPLALVTVIALLDGFGLVHHASHLYGFDYMPQGLVSLLIVILAAVLLVVNRRRTGLLLVSLSLFALACRGDCSFDAFRSQPQSEEEVTFTVITLNVEWYRRGFTRIVAGIREIDPDIVLINENMLPDEAGEVYAADLPQYHYATGRPGETAILSKYPIMSVTEVEFPSRQTSPKEPNRIEDIANNAHRSFLHAIIDINGTPVNVISVRFIAGRPPSYTLGDQFRWGKFVLIQQMEEVQFFNDYITEEEGPVVFGGDLNATASSKVIRQLRKVSRDAFLANHFYGRATFRVPNVMSRLDYIFLKGPIRSLKSEVVHIKVSDHYPVYVELAVARSPE